MARLKTHKRNNEVFIGSSSSEINCLREHKRRASAGKPINFLETSCSEKRNGPSYCSSIEKKKMCLSLIELDDPAIEREDLWFSLVIC
ncbi:hypothetical protein CDAR_480521 [Caerostris darwini]|uniref:Ycf15 n=1 Tax=Caerostris darwini TaxID=1538125 RepID=A0AAV4V0D6_9ARAC|nr:hypothetical protein CDAR_480521 [Caerostris darwini]